MKLYGLNEGNAALPALQDFLSGGDNRIQMRRLRRILPAAIEGELTEKQRYYLIQHYFEGLSTSEIAAHCHVNRVTVYRHIQKAKMRLQKALQYTLSLPSDDALEGD